MLQLIFITGCIFAVKKRIAPVARRIVSRHQETERPLTLDEPVTDILKVKLEPKATKAATAGEGDQAEASPQG